MVESLVVAVNLLGTKAIIAYIVVIVVIVGVALYTRRGAPGR
ncbi:MAG TPA: hypothetical protein VFE42_36445 [Chloroflexota bacterium]|nr:hypothetical protein [Chloroflexota bacterium]